MPNSELNTFCTMVLSSPNTRVPAHPLPLQNFHDTRNPTEIRPDSTQQQQHARPRHANHDALRRAKALIATLHAVAVKQHITAPTSHNSRQFPTEVAGVTITSVSTQSANRRPRVRRISADENPISPEISRDEKVPVPRLLCEHLVVHGSHEFTDDTSWIRRPSLRMVDPTADKIPQTLIGFNVRHNCTTDTRPGDLVLVGRANILQDVLADFLRFDEEARCLRQVGKTIVPEFEISCNAPTWTVTANQILSTHSVVLVLGVRLTCPISHLFHNGFHETAIGAVSLNLTESKETVSIQHLHRSPRLC
mmetsp:Transcript_56282/g.150425  ORF Transcript_56282/g.150425 Transcript_56282/m.150425 type:complete len:307 (-) Transcript_56282:1959-2879(-)